MELGLSERFIELLENLDDFESLKVVARNTTTGEIGSFFLPFQVDVPNAYDWEIVDFVTGERFRGKATLRRQVMNLNEVECDALKRLDLLPPNLGVANETYSWLITASEEQAKFLRRPTRAFGGSDATCFRVERLSDRRRVRPGK